MRNFHGDTNPGLPQVELSLADIQEIFPIAFLQQLEVLQVCGNYGDSTAARDTVEVMRYFRTASSGLLLQIMTHGSARSAEWWRELAALKVRCIFGLDGLEDTNHIYRRGTNWKLIMRNVSAFIGAGGDAEWDFIVFAHNEHQVEDARKLSQEMGFNEFIVKKTGRFVRKAEQPIFARDGSVEDTLRAPQRPEFQNEVLQRINREDPATYVETTPIYCKAVASSSVYVSAEALVFPCCYLGGIYSPFGSQVLFEKIQELAGDLPSICAFNSSIAEIVDGPFFQDAIPAGWDFGLGRIKTCANMCGSCDYVGAQTDKRLKQSAEERRAA